MADLAEILSFEHLAIRHIRKESVLWQEHTPLSEFHRYLRECHIEIEERIFFPVLKESTWDDSKEFLPRIEKIIADHKLINTLFENLEKWYNKGNLSLYRERFALYFRLLQEHNDREEALLFSRWQSLPENTLKDTVKEAKNVIESFGIQRYVELLGFTPSGFTYVFRTS